MPVPESSSEKSSPEKSSPEKSLEAAVHENTLAIAKMQDRFTNFAEKATDAMTGLGENQTRLTEAISHLTDSISNLTGPVANVSESTTTLMESLSTVTRVMVDMQSSQVAMGAAIAQLDAIINTVLSSANRKGPDSPDNLDKKG